MSNREAVARYKATEKGKATIAARAALQSTKDKGLEAARRHRLADWSRSAIPRIRHRAAKSGLEFAISREDIVVPDVCPVLGIPIILPNGISRFLSTPNCPSVDRKDNSKGYVRGNIAVISMRANVLKRDASTEEIEMLAKWMKQEGCP